LLDFIHDYGNENGDTNIIYLSFCVEDGNYYLLDNSKVFDEPSINITHSFNHFDIRETLELLNYAINNIEEVKQNQKKRYLKNYNVYIRTSIDSSIINQNKKNKSEIVDKILESKIYTQSVLLSNSSVNISDISYFSKNNKYFIYITDDDGKEIVIDTLKHIFLATAINKEISNFPFGSPFLIFEDLYSFKFYEKNIFDNFSFRKSKLYNIGKLSDDYLFTNVKAINLFNDVYFIQFSGMIGESEFLFFEKENKIVKNLKDEFNRCRKIDTNKE